VTSSAANTRPRRPARSYTSFIQTTATLGFFVSLAVIGACRIGFGAERFKEFGWRVPFIASFILLGVSLYIRLRSSSR
jgi:hypothetical protein